MFPAWITKSDAIHLVLAGICMAMLVGCGSSVEFVHEPPAAFRVPMPVGVQGVWAREGKDNGERVRVSSLEDGAVRFDFFKTRSSGEPLPVESMIAQALRFDNRDWLLLDRRKLIGPDGGSYTGTAPYMLAQYAMENPDRLCGILPSGSMVAEAIESGKLEGKVETYVKPWIRVTVTAAGADWVKWWNNLPDAEKRFVQPVFCFQKIN
jgi:hypothetical protein